MLATVTALRLRRALLAAADRLLPADAVLLELSSAAAVTRLLGAAVETGALDALRHGPATAEQVARSRSLHAETVHRVLRALAVCGVVRLDRRGRFRLTRVGRLACDGGPESMAAWVRYVNTGPVQGSWARLAETVRDGRPCFEAVHGRTGWEYLAAHPDDERLFAAAMSRLTRMDAPAVARAYPWPHTGTVCDVGGGVGTLLAEVLEHRRRLRGILVEAAGPLAQAGPYLEERGVAGRVRLVQADLFAGFEAPADCYVLKDVLHDWDDRRCLTILGQVRRAAAVGSRLVVVEWLQPPNLAAYPVSLADINMLACTDGGRQRSAAELQRLGAGAGFRPGRVVRLAGESAVELVAS